MRLTLLLLAGAASGMINSGTPDGVPASFDCALRSLAYDYGRALLPGRGTFRTLFDALGGMLQFLGGENSQLAERCTMLAVFPEDSQVPLAVVAQLWGVDEVETEEVVTELFKGGTALRALVHTRSVFHPTLAPPGTFRAKGCTPID